ncbi:unnamed protein product [Bursaphelenchus xylophilus]|uniref:(pine wood nematode) hypothetical protein n=1 Tax=Bursaphelenchus xylophilus TaxID=6326 RepID=A0A7I8WKG5_BURXY|nr:unnamed protein product [Bursaphelenchus xylophilus]CAG9106778.1 unnamed protein product [Bursaphelenchus xylophilus]
MNYIATLEQLDRLADRARQEDLEKNQRLEGIPSRRSVRTSASRNSNSSSRGKSRDGGSNNRNYMKNDYVPSERCNDPTCDICSGLATRPASNRAATPNFTLQNIGLNQKIYPFSQRLAQLDAAINMLTQILDQRLRAERYRDAQDLGDILKELTEKRRKCQELLDERRNKLGDLNEAQRLKNEYDTMIYNAVDINRLRRHLTVGQLVDLERLKRF